jgi:hypothetical protein
MLTKFIGTTHNEISLKKKQFSSCYIQKKRQNQHVHFCNFCHSKCTKKCVRQADRWIETLINKHTGKTKMEKVTLKYVHKTTAAAGKTNCLCVFVALGIQYAMCMRHIVI